ncbi:MAG: META domain-containing protein [Thermomicrobiales bacterium]|nr:META domain-containing protein [Thermomicrobiales bacterium]
MHLAGLPLLLLLSLALLHGQATPVPGAGPVITPVVWDVVSLPNDGTPIPVADGTRYTIQFLPGGTVAVHADCNQATGTYTIASDAISVEVTASTLALCPPGSRSDALLQTLSSVTTLREDANGDLLLSGPSGIIRLRPTLSGVIWEWQGLQSGDGSVVTPNDPATYTLAFLPDGKLAIRADCNRAIGTYATDGPAIDLTIGGVTRALCRPGSHMQEYLRDLDLVSSHVFRGGNLFLALPADAGILEFRARIEETGQATPEAG